MEVEVLQDVAPHLKDVAPPLPKDVAQLPAAEAVPAAGVEQRLRLPRENLRTGFT